MENQNQIAVKVVSDLFNTQLTRADKMITGMSDEELARETSPGRNTGVYLLGHLTAVHDAMLPLLGFGETLHPELVEVFLKNPDKSGLPKPPVAQLREHWTEVNKALTTKLQALTTDDWFDRHKSASEEDFKKEPDRNRLNIVAGRTNHLTYHLGQMTFLKK